MYNWYIGVFEPQGGTSLHKSFIVHLFCSLVKDISLSLKYADAEIPASLESDNVFVNMSCEICNAIAFSYLYLISKL